MGSVGVLNVSGGDIEIKFDTQNTAECIRAKRMIADMLRRGYALLIEVDGKFTRCLEFKEDVGVYIVADFDPSGDLTKEVTHERREDGPSQTVDTMESTDGLAEGPNGQASDEVGRGKTPEKRGPRRPRKGTKSVPMQNAKARAVPRTSGG